MNIHSDDVLLERGRALIVLCCGENDEGSFLYCQVCAFERRISEFSAKWQPTDHTDVLWLRGTLVSVRVAHCWYVCADGGYVVLEPVI